MPKQLMKYRVVREHYGEKAYVTGDTREAFENEVEHLVPHVLVLEGPADPAKPAEKSEQKPLNKAEGAAPANKAARSRTSKRK